VNDWLRISVLCAISRFRGRGDETLNPHISETAKDSPINIILQKYAIDWGILGIKILFTVHLECDIAVDKKEIRDYKHGDYNTIRSILSDVNWDSLMTGTDAF